MIKLFLFLIFVKESCGKLLPGQYYVTAPSFPLRSETMIPATAGILPSVLEPKISSINKVGSYLRPLTASEPSLIPPPVLLPASRTMVYGPAPAPAQIPLPVSAPVPKPFVVPPGTAPITPQKGITLNIPLDILAVILQSPNFGKLFDPIF